MATTASGSGPGSGTAALCFLVACLLLASPSSFVAGTEAAAAYGAGAGAGAGRKLMQTSAGAMGYPGTNLPPATYPAVPCCP